TRQCEDNSHARRTTHHAPSHRICPTLVDSWTKAVITNWETLRFVCLSSFRTYAICRPALMLLGRSVSIVSWACDCRLSTYGTHSACPARRRQVVLSATEYPAVVRMLDRQRPRCGGRKEKVTVLFCPLRTLRNRFPAATRSEEVRERSKRCAACAGMLRSGAAPAAAPPRRPSTRWCSASPTSRARHSPPGRHRILPARIDIPSAGHPSRG